MRTCRLLLCLGAVGCLGACVLLSHVSHRIRWENYAEIRVNMSEREVAEILGGPPGDYSTGQVGLPPDWPFLGFPEEDRRFWIGDGVAIRVSLDSRGRVSDTAKRGRQPESLLDKARRLLGL